MNIDIKIVIPMITLIIIVVILLSRHIILGPFILYKISIFPNWERAELSPSKIVA